MKIKYFYHSNELEQLDSRVFPGGEERVILKLRYGGKMILRQGVLANHICVYWNSNSDINWENFLILLDVNRWKEFFEVVNGPRSPPEILITPPEIVITPPKENFTR